LPPGTRGAEALDRLTDLLYSDLKRIARQQLQRRRTDDNLDSAALASEA
jgi:hypothetical protein